MNPYLLMYGTDDSLLRTRSMVLGRMGLPIITAREFQEVKRFAEEVPVAVLILCHTLGPDQREEAIAAVGKRSKGVKCLVLANRFTRPELHSACAVVCSADGRQGLLMTVDELLHGTATVH